MIQTDYVSLEFGMAEKMRCDNDWGELKEIIVGTAKGYHFPDYNKSFHSCEKGSIWHQLSSMGY